MPAGRHRPAKREGLTQRDEEIRNVWQCADQSGYS